MNLNCASFFTSNLRFLSFDYFSFIFFFVFASLYHHWVVLCTENRLKRKYITESDMRRFHRNQLVEWDDEWTKQSKNHMQPKSSKWMNGNKNNTTAHTTEEIEEIIRFFCVEKMGNFKRGFLRCCRCCFYFVLQTLRLQMVAIKINGMNGMKTLHYIHTHDSHARYTDECYSSKDSWTTPAATNIFFFNLQLFTWKLKILPF